MQPIWLRPAAATLILLQLGCASTAPTPAPVLACPRLPDKPAIEPPPQSGSYSEKLIDWRKSSQPRLTDTLTN